VDLLCLEVPWRSPQSIGELSSRWQGANEIQLSLGYYNGFAIKPKLQASFAALKRFDNSQLIPFRLLDADKISWLERGRSQWISLQD
jgi:hypothetical protein